jgi:signal transduction histidine kinase
MGLRPFEMTALDLAVQLTGRSPETIRRKMSRAIFDQQPLSLPVTISRDGKRFQLYISSLAEDTNGHTETDDAYPFDLYGILFEMIDITDVQELQHLKAQLFEHSTHYIRSDVESLSNVCNYLDDSSLHEDKKAELLHIVEQQKEKLMDFIHQLNGYMGREGIASSIGVFPVNPLKIIEETTVALHEKMAERNLDVKVSPSTMTELVLAAPDKFKRLLRAVFMILINDADEDTAIQVRFSIEKRRVLCHFENSGYGMPDDIFQTYIAEESAAPSEFFKTIRALTPGLSAWQASLSGHSELGQGIRFVLKLMKF